MDDDAPDYDAMQRQDAALDAVMHPEHKVAQQVLLELKQRKAAILAANLRGMQARKEWVRDDPSSASMPDWTLADQLTKSLNERNAAFSAAVGAKHTKQFIPEPEPEAAATAPTPQHNMLMAVLSKLRRSKQ